MIQKQIILILILFLSITGCKSKDYLNEEVTIEDLLTIEQDHKKYITKGKLNKLIIPKEYHKMLEKKYREKFLAIIPTGREQNGKIIILNCFLR